MESSLLAGGAVVLLVPLALLAWAVVTSLWDDIDGPVTFVRFFGLLSVVVTVAVALLAPNPGLAVVAGLVVAGLIILIFSALN